MRNFNLDHKEDTTVVEVGTDVSDLFPPHCVLVRMSPAFLPAEILSRRSEMFTFALLWASSYVWQSRWHQSVLLFKYSEIR